jgi:hypothetical protein
VRKPSGKVVDELRVGMKLIAPLLGKWLEEELSERHHGETGAVGTPFCKKAWCPDNESYSGSHFAIRRCIMIPRISDKNMSRIEVTVRIYP